MEEVAVTDAEYLVVLKAILWVERSERSLPEIYAILGAIFHGRKIRGIGLEGAARRVLEEHCLGRAAFIKGNVPFFRSVADGWYGWNKEQEMS